MNSTQLSAFAAVAETGSVTRGAALLMVSQPAVSLQVAELESVLKTTLFDRLPRGVRLTAAGELLYGYVRRIHALEAEAERAIAELMGLARGQLQIGASLTIGSYLLPAMLGKFRQAHPQIDLQLQIGNSQQVEKLLMDGQIDLGFTEGLEDAPLKPTVFHTDRLVAIAPPDHPILTRKRITTDAFCRIGLILRERGSGTREVIESYLAKKKIDAKPVMSLGSTEAIKRAVISGLGVAIVSELAIDAEVAAEKLVVVPVSDLAIRRPLYLARPPGRADSAAAAAFAAMIGGVGA